MILYHGSNISIDKIDLSKSKPNKDFGKGFYLSATREQAEEMARFKSLILGGQPVVSEFIFNEDAIHSDTLNVLIFREYTEEWLDFILLNRSEEKYSHSYDIVYGPIANDKVGAQILRYKEHNINKEELLQRLKFVKGITFQYFFGTEKAVSYLKPL